MDEISNMESKIALMCGSDFGIPMATQGHNAGPWEKALPGQEQATALACYSFFKP